MQSSPLKRNAGESDFEYHCRIIDGKLGSRILNDYDYSELSVYAYGKKYSSDCARRMFYGSKRTLDYLAKEQKSQIDNDEVLAELNEKLQEIQKERYRLFDQRREYNNLIRHESREEHLYSSLCEAANCLNDNIGRLYNDSVPIVKHNDSEAILVFCDWHYGMITNNIFNTYDTDICKERVKRTVDFAIDKIRLHGCSKLHVVILGDLFHGSIHTSARVASEELVCDQLMQASEILAQSLLELNKYVPKTIVYTTYGNHGRTIQNKNDSIHRDNMERIIPWWLAQRLSDNENIELCEDTGNEFLLVNACGHSIAASHGDLDSVKSSPRLFASLFQKQLGINIEYVILADKHHRESFEELGVSAVICGSLCGTDDYANDKRLYSTPSQLLLIATPENGVEAEYRIKC